jgi:hypothetical protein
MVEVQTKVRFTMGSQYPNESQKGGKSSQEGGKQPQEGQPQQGQQGGKQPSQQARDSHTNSSRAGEGTGMPSDIRPDHPDGAEPDRAGRSGQQPPPQSGNR